MINFMIREDVKTNGYCRFTTSSELRDYASFAFQWGFPKGSLYASAFSELIFLTFNKIDPFFDVYFCIN